MLTTRSDYHNVCKQFGLSSNLEPQILGVLTSSGFSYNDITSTLWTASGTNQGAIDNRIEQAMDLVKSHLMNAVRSEVEELKEKIIKLEETINQQQIELTTSASNFNREVGKLQAENQFLRNHVGSDVINQLSNLEFYDPVNQATQQQQQNQVQNIQDSQSIQVSTTKQTAPSTQSQQSHQ